MWISEQTATFVLYIINWLVFITVVERVYCAVRTDSLYKADYVSSLKWLRSGRPLCWLKERTKPSDTKQSLNRSEKRPLTTKTAPALRNPFLYENPPPSQPLALIGSSRLWAKHFPVFIPLNTNPGYHFYGQRLWILELSVSSETSALKKLRRRGDYPKDTLRQHMKRYERPFFYKLSAFCHLQNGQMQVERTVALHGAPDARVRKKLLIN